MAEFRDTAPDTAVGLKPRDQDMCHSHQSVKQTGQIKKIEANVFEIKGEKKITFFACGEGGITNPLKTPAQGGGDIFALKRLNAVV